MFNPYSLYLVTDTEMMKPLGMSNIIECAINNGVTCVQLRDKKMSTAQFVELAKSIKKLLSKTDISLFINDRVDVALAVEVDGVHLGQSDMSYLDARKILGHKYKVGVTLDTPDDFHKYKNESIQYYGLSSIFPSTTKLDTKNIWTKNDIKKIKTKTPLIGIGGINTHNVDAAMKLGLDGVAVVSDICAAKSLNEVQLKSQSYVSKISRFHENR